MPAQINETWSMDCMHDQLDEMRILQAAGCGLAIMPGPTWHLAASHQNRSLPWPLKLNF